MIKVKETILPDKTKCYTINFKNKEQKEEAKKHIAKEKGKVICVTYLKDNKGYYEYIKE